MKTLIKDYLEFSLWKVEKEDISNITKLVLKTNYQRHLKLEKYPASEYLQALCDDMNYAITSHYYAIYSQRMNIVGSIRAMEWNCNYILPIERDFGINIKQFISTLKPIPDKIWHIGRFAIDQNEICSNRELIKRRITILKLLLFMAFRHIGENEMSIAFCECDYKLFEKLLMMGVNAIKCGETKTFLGSQTVPVYASCTGVKNFIESNKLLLNV